MDEQQRDKGKKKKKSLKRETQDGDQVDRKASQAPHHTPPPYDPPTDPRPHRPHGPGERPTNTPDGFHIPRPRTVDPAAHFRDLHTRKLAELSEAFHIFDFDRDGQINEDDLRKTFASLCMDVQEEEIKHMLSEASSPLNLDAFVILLAYRTLDLDPEEVLLDALANWDDHHGGLVSYERLMHHLMAWGEKFTEEEAESALADAPVVLSKAKEKMIDYIQFSEDLCGLRKMMQKRTTEEVARANQ